MNDIDAILLVVLLYLIWRTRESFVGGAVPRLPRVQRSINYFLTEFPYEADSDLVNMSGDQVKLAKLF